MEKRLFTELGLSPEILKAVGAIDIFEAETHVDIAEEFVELVITKLNGIRIREVRLKPCRITT